MRGDTRGQAEVLGTLLLVGIVVAAALLIMGVAMASFGDLQSQSEEEAIEGMLLDLRSATADIAIEGEAPQSFDIAPPAGASVSINETATAVRIEHHGYNNSTESSSQTLYEHPAIGTVEVEHDDVTYALEGGGIFRVDDGRSRLVAPPNFGLSSFTANIQVLRLESEGINQLQRTITIAAGTHIRPAYPDLDTSYSGTDQPFDNPVMNGSVDIVVQSEYYLGWSQFFTQYTDGNVTVDHENETVTATMESMNEMTLSQEITYSKDFTTRGNVEYDGVEQSEFLPDNTPIIENQIEDTASESDNITEACGNESIDGCELTGGTYYFEDGLTVSDDVVINTTEDVIIAVEGDFDLGASITVTGDPEHGVEYFVTGEFNTDGDYSIRTDNEAVEAHRNLVHLGGDHANIAGNVQLDIVLYAPNAHVDIAGTSAVTGAIISDELTMRGDATVSYDSQLESLEGIDLSKTETPIMYLHITENTAVLDG